ncbi:hypothetical protein LA080_010094 [Diaporthe eres]|uniref:Uncharacterized protein n=1 Tax=Diaporthe vaccinii TaxID=105482 RepID=A0ABR4ERP1_9PEZI|nr:hypothetical protein LA080_010094 [Diaporthe eres]
MRFTTSTTALLISLALTVSAAPTKPSTSLKNPPEQGVSSIVGGALDLAGGITSDAGADKVGDALSGAGDSVDGSDAEKKKKPHRVRSLKRGDKGDKDGKKEAAAGATGGALELAGAITSAAGAGKVGDALSAAGGAVDGKKGGDGKAGDGKGCDGAAH